jgi:hypothetical protein
VKLRRAPATIPGAISGSVTRQNVWTGRAPRSSAASSSERSKPESRARTTIATYDTLKTTCASTTVHSDRRSVTAPKNVTSAAPITISGMMIGRYSRLFVKPEPLNS